MASTKRGDGEAISGFGGVTAGRVKMLNSRGDTIDFAEFGCGYRSVVAVRAVTQKLVKHSEKKR